MPNYDKNIRYSPYRKREDGKKKPTAKAPLTLKPKDKKEGEK